MADDMCCAGLSSSKKNIDKKGFAIVEKNYKEISEYYLQFKSVDEDKKDDLLKIFRENLIGSDLPNIALVGEVKIKFCPWCGNKL